MDKRTLRSRKGKSRNARPYDRQNQTIFGKVCSTVKGLLNPSSWFNVSHWISNSEEQHGGSSDNVEEENDNINSDGDVVSQSVSNASKRLRLRLDGHSFQDGPSIQSSETQTWPEQPSQNLYEPIRIVSPPSTATQSSLLENKEVMAVINGDDHSENSEGSASTSGCSSLVSSHKESNRLGERPFGSLLDVKSSRKRKETSPKSDYNDFNHSRGLWSSNFNPSLKFQRRYPTVSHTNQPNFNLSSFAGPSRLNESSEKKTSSPFYEGKTTFGGASAFRRMPASVVPYQVDRSLRNQIRVRDQTTEDNLKPMSSAAERILLTLHKISSPVSDAKRIPNLETSPVDLSVYLTPPKSRWNSQLTPSVASKGPPIANINTIARLATLKNYGTSRLRSTPQGASVTSAEQKTPSFDILQPNTPDVISQKSGGGKMKNKLNQHHISSKQGMAEHEVMDTPALKSIPLPITSLPTINFGSKPEKTMNSHLSSSSFTFSKPIEHDLSVSNTVPTSTLSVHSPYDSFKFAHPIDYDLSNNSQPKENLPSPTWECNVCWVRNPQSKTSCLACETPRETKENKNSITSNASAFSSFETSTTKSSVFTFGSKPLENTAASTPTSVNFKFGQSETTKNQIPISETRNNHASSFGSAAANFTFGSSSIRETSKENSSSVSDTAANKCGSPMGFTFGTKNQNSNPVSQKQTGSASTHENTTKSHFSTLAAFTADSTKTWECKECWVKNPSKESKCLACETPRSSKTTVTATSSFASSTSATISTNSTLGNWECNTCLIKNPINESKCMACETSKPGGDKNSGVNILTSNTFSTWECTSCWVRNPMKEKKCMACETLHPNTDVNSAVKDNSGFKFSSPLQNSPITFKFGNYVCTATSTATTSTFKFGVSVTESQTTTTNSGFKFGTSNANIFASPAVSESVNKVSDSLPSTTQSSATTGFKILDATLVSGKTQNNNVSNSSGVSQTKSISESKATESVSESKNSCVTKNNADDAVIKTKESAPEPEKKNSFISNPLHLEESSKEKLPDAVITSSSSNVPNPSVTACFGFTTKPIESKDTKENKPSVFKLTSESPSLSAFKSPVNLFKFGGEKVDSTKNSLSSASVTLATTTTTASFGFSSSGSTFGTVTNPKITEVTSTTANSNPVTIKTEESTTVASTIISTAVTTSSPFVFGSSVTTSTPSAFSFFPTSSAPSSSAPATATTTASTTTTSVFSFGASSNQSGGFTFKGLEKPQTTSAVSSASQSAPTSLNAGISTQVPSFQPPVFGASKTEAPPVMSAPPVTFTFGAGVTTVSSNASAFSAFQPSQPGNPSFQFGSQIPGSTPSTIGSSANFVFSKSDAPNPTSSSVSQNTVPAFGSTTSNFVFGSKNENSNQIHSAVSQPSGIAFGSSPSFTFSNKNDNSDTASQKPPLPFGSSTIPVFGNTPVQPSFDGPDKPATGGFNFGTSPSTVFQFGAGSNNTDKKRTATASGFSFGTPSATETNASSFPTGFSMNTPPSFNFGAASTPAGPFQFAASGAAAKPASTVNSGPRKIRKAVRRVNRGKD